MDETMDETIAGGLSGNEPIAFDLADYVERLNKFLYEADFVTAESLTEDISRVSTETGLTAEQIQSVMTSTLTIMEERREEAVAETRLDDGRPRLPQKIELTDPTAAQGDWQFELARFIDDIIPPCYNKNTKPSPKARKAKARFPK